LIFLLKHPVKKEIRDEINFYPVEVDFGGAVQEFHIGLGSMAVPGNIAGVFHVHKRLGRLPFKLLLNRLYTMLKMEFLNRFQYYCLTSILKPIIIGYKEGRQVFGPTGELIEPEGLLIMKEFADTLAYLAKKGAREFYEGEIAHRLVKDCHDLGGYLTLEDLKNYRVIEREPLLIDYRGNTLLTNPPPSSGGTLIAFALKLLSKVEFN
jgi:gamma-glutamyltranspeptidase/glutathione hydrolase